MDDMLMTALRAITALDDARVCSRQGSDDDEVDS
jgi:hypothetical protein